MTKSSGEIIQELIITSVLAIDIQYFPIRNILVIEEDELVISLKLNSNGYYNHKEYIIQQIDGLVGQGPNLLVLSLICNT